MKKLFFINIILLLIIVNCISALEVLTQRGSIDNGYTNIGSVWGDGTYIYAAGNDAGYALTFNGSEFTQVGSTTDNVVQYWGDGTYIYYGTYDGVFFTANTFNGTDFTQITSLSASLLGGARSIWGDGTYIYTADYYEGIKAFTFDGTNFTLEGSNDTYSSSVGVWGDGTYLYLVNYDGQTLFALTFNGTNFNQEASIFVGGTARTVWGDGTYIYVADNTGGLVAYSFNGTEFTEIDRNLLEYNPGEYDEARDVWGDGTYIYVAGGTLAWAFTFDGGTLTEIDRVSTGDSYGVWGDGTYIYIAATTNGVIAYELINITSCSVCNETCSPCGGGCTATSLYAMFDGVTDFDTVVGDITGWDTSCITDMGHLFRNTDGFNQDIGGWDTSSVISFNQMFESAEVFNQDLSSWITSNVIDMWGTFYGAYEFNGDITTWDTSSVTTMGYMFYTTYEFNQDISGWDTSQVTDMSWMFDSNYYFNQPIGSWDVHSVTNMQNMFGDARSFNQDLSSWDTSNVEDMSIMFGNAFQSTYDFNGDVTTWDTSSVTDMNRMFYRSFSFDQDISGWSTSNVVDMSEMFYQASAFNQDISSLDTSIVTDMSGMFNGATSFDQDLGGWDTTSVTNMANMFNDVTLSSSNYDSLLTGWGSMLQQSDVTFSGGDSIYTSTGVAGRNILTDTYNWIITDGGFVCLIDSDCGFCEYCNVGTCDYQFNTDLKDECTGASVCDGYGSCSEDVSNYTIINFTSDGTFEWSGDPINVTVLVIAGGGGGGCGGAGAGGGGAGGVIYQENYLVTGNVNIVVGNGGAGVTCEGYNDYTGYNGSDSSFGNITTVGGGGGSSGNVNGADGGSGGGADGGYTATLGGIGTIGQGYDGGNGEHIYGTCPESYSGGAGGGAGGIGGNGNAVECRGGNGGTGRILNITGFNICYAGGGAGGNWKADGGNVGGTATCGGGNGGADTSAGVNGIDGKGGGGGGAGGGISGGSTTGGDGGNGIVIVRYYSPMFVCTLDTDCESCQYCNAGVCTNQTNTDTKVDCPLCQWCNAGSCVAQTTGQDIKNECPFYRQCANPWGGHPAHSTYETLPGYCDGFSHCRIPFGLPTEVTNGNVCINGTLYDVNPTASIHCSIWKDCVDGNTYADEYYVGFQKPYMGGCTANDWQPAGLVWNTPSGYAINYTEQAASCQITLTSINVNVTPGSGSEPVNITATNVTNIQNITTLMLEAPTADIVVDFSGVSVNYTNIVPEAIVITERSVTIDAIISPELDKPARLSFGNIGSDYVIYRNGFECGDYCSNVVYERSSRTLSFDVSGFSTYSVGAAAAEGCEDTKMLVFAAFALIAIIIIVTAAFALINFSNLDALTTIAISSIGLAIVLFVGYYIISAVQTAICSV